MPDATATGTEMGVRLASEWRAFMNAPFITIGLVTLAAIAVWFAVTWLKSNKIEALEERLKLRDDEIAALKKPKPVDAETLAKEEADLDPDWESKLKVVSGKTFMNTDVVLDGHYYRGCEFHNVTFIHNGGPLSLTHNKIGNHTIRTKNISLQRFSNLLVSLGHIKTRILTETGPITSDEWDARNYNRRGPPSA